MGFGGEAEMETRGENVPFGSVPAISHRQHLQSPGHGTPAFIAAQVLRQGKGSGNPGNLEAE